MSQVDDGRRWLYPLRKEHFSEIKVGLGHALVLVASGHRPLPMGGRDSVRVGAVGNIQNSNKLLLDHSVFPDSFFHPGNNIQVFQKHLFPRLSGFFAESNQLLL